MPVPAPALARAWSLPRARPGVLIDQEVPRVEVYSRSGGRWLFEEVEGLEASLHLDAIGVTLPLAELYEGVDLTRGAETVAGAASRQD